MSLVIWPPQSPALVASIREAAGDLPVHTPADEAAALAVAGEATGWIGRLTPALLAAAPRLRWLQATSVSLESVIFPALAASDIALTNMRHVFNDHISTHVLALLLAHCRDLPRLIRRQIAGVWSPQDEMQILDPAAMTLLIMGLGGIGAEVARRAAVFGPTIIGVDPKLSTAPEGVTELHAPDRLADLLPRADAVIICAPQTPETTGLFDEALFRHMRPSALFINIGRGKIVQLAALERALAEGWIAGAGLDVFETEPLAASSPLWGMENVIITPHVAGLGPHVDERRLQIVLDNVRRFAANQPLANITDKARWY